MVGKEPSDGVLEFQPDAGRKQNLRSPRQKRHGQINFALPFGGTERRTEGQDFHRRRRRYHEFCARHQRQVPPDGRAYQRSRHRIQKPFPQGDSAEYDRRPHVADFDASGARRRKHHRPHPNPRQGRQTPNKIVVGQVNRRTL